MTRPVPGKLTGRATFFCRRLSPLSFSGWRLIAAAALLHVALASGLFCAARAQAAPALIDRDGIMGSFAFDSYEYQRGAVRLAAVLRREGVAAWATEHEPVHVKLISIQFALLGPLLGYGTLSAEPFNLFCYLAVLTLVFTLAREAGGRRVGLISAAAVALWPTFLLHTLQLLKDPLFIAGALALILCVTTWLTRDYDRLSALGTGALMAVMTVLLLLIRFNFVVVIFALALIGFILLVVRQRLERRRLYWNMVCPVLILLTTGVLIPLHMARASQKFKRFPSDGSGQPKAVAGAGEQIPSIVSYLPRTRPKGRAPQTYAEQLYAAADRAALRVGSIRSRFNAVYPESGSSLDRDVGFRDVRGLVLYLPRAFEVGLWSPFPDTWAAAGRRVGSAGRLLSGAETLVIYACQLLALVAVFRPPRRLASWLLLAITVFGVTVLGLVVPNVGALYRFRYTFWVLLIILGVKGLESVVKSDAGRLRARRAFKELTNRSAACVALACLLAACSCSSHAAGGAAESMRTQEASAGASARAAVGEADNMDFALTNFTGSSLRAVYVSPGDSKGWEENILGADKLADGDTVDIRFNLEERAALWDIRVEGGDGRYAELKGIGLRDVSRITLRLNLAGGTTVVAEVE